MEQEERQVRKRSPKGARTQKHVAFRCDFENVEWLEKQPNKGRYINELIAADRRKEVEQHEIL